MSRTTCVVTAVISLTLAAWLLPAASQPAQARSAAAYVNAVDLDVVPSQIQPFLAAIKENGAATVKEAGCRQFDILALATDPNHIFLYEVYENEAAYLAHRSSEHFKKYAATTKDMIARRDARPMTPVAFNAKAR